MAEVPLHLDRRSLDPGCPIVLLEGRPPRAYYDPRQIKYELALEALNILTYGHEPASKASSAEGGLRAGGVRAGCPPAEGSGQESQSRILRSMDADDDQGTPG